MAGRYGLFSLLVFICFSHALFAESASLYPHLKKSAYAASHPITTNQNRIVQQNEPLPAETIIPVGSRIVAGEENKNEFYILTKDQKDPIIPSKMKAQLSPAQIENHLKEMDVPSHQLIKLNQQPDEVLNQVVKHTSSSKQMKKRVSPTPSAGMIVSLAQQGKLQKNGEVANLDVALDKMLVKLKHIGALKTPHQIMATQKPHSSPTALHQRKASTPLLERV